tara:strand:+ start:2282 stop:2470 length:189 start_codon:yes stop_codon:yes gene_type:complete
MSAGVHIGAIADKDSLDALASAFVKIIQSGGDPKTARLAIECIGKAAKVENVQIGTLNVVNK